MADDEKIEVRAERIAKQANNLTSGQQSQSEHCSTQYLARSFDGLRTPVDWTINPIHRAIMAQRTRTRTTEDKRIQLQLCTFIGRMIDTSRRGMPS
jgi:hypothetical protein